MQNNNLIATQQTVTTPKLQKALDLSNSIVQTPSEIALIEMDLQLSDNFGKPLVRAVFKGENGRLGFTVVRVLVQRFLESFAFTQKLNPVQVDNLTVDTLEHFKYETLEDIMLFFKMARTGKFGAAKKGIDANIIFGEWFPQYLDLKAQEREKRVHNAKFQHKVEENNPVVQEFYAKQRIRQQYERDLERIDQMVKSFNREKLEETIEKWQKDNDLKKFLPYLKTKRREITK